MQPILSLHWSLFMHCTSFTALQISICHQLLGGARRTQARPCSESWRIPPRITCCMLCWLRPFHCTGTVLHSHVAFIGRRSYYMLPAINSCMLPPHCGGCCGGCSCRVADARTGRPAVQPRLHRRHVF